MILDAIAKLMPAALVRKVLAVYEGARHSEDRSLIHEAIQSARFDADKSTRDEILRKSRYFEKNSALLNRMADLLELYTVGGGLQILPASSNPKWNANAKAYLETWSQSPDLSSLQAFGTLQSLMARSWFIDGELFILKTKGESGFPRIQLFESHLVGTPDHLREDPSVVDGIQLDPRGRPVAYYIGTETRRGKIEFGPPTPAAQVIHLFEPSRTGQLRGLAFVYPVINDLHDLDDLQVLQMRRSKKNADVTDVIKSASPELQPDALRRQRVLQTNTTAAGQTVTEARVEYIRQVLGGRSILLKPGEDFQQFKDDQPSVANREYWRYLAEKICIGVGMPYVLVCPDSMQGTVYRGAIASAAAFFRTRHAVIATAVRQIYEYIMGWARYKEPTLRDAPANWRNVSIHAPRDVEVDLGRNSAAMLNELSAGATTYELIYSPLGLDWREQFERLAEQQKYARELGLQIAFPGQPAATQADPQKPATEDDAADDDDEKTNPEPKEANA